MDTFSILAKLSTHLPQIKLTLGERWPDFAAQMQAQAALFENLADETALVRSADQLYGLFMRDETIRNILNSPSSHLGGMIRHPDPIARPGGKDKVPLQMTANRFILLCKKPNEVAEQEDPFEYVKQADTQVDVPDQTDSGSKD